MRVVPYRSHVLRNAFEPSIAGRTRMDASHALEAQVSAETTHRRSSAAMMVEGNLSCQRDVYQTGTDVHSAHSFYTGQPISQGGLSLLHSQPWVFF